MNASSSEQKMKYLSLALFAQRTIRALIAFKRVGDREPIRKRLEEAHTSLNQVATGGTSNVRSFMYYEQVRTLQEVNQHTEDIVAVLKSIVDGKSTKEDVDKAIQYFHELEKQALINCERPEEQIPASIRQLWQTT